jgi:hypothetical protein
LLKVINDYNLQQYSLEALARLKNPPVTPVIESTAAVAKETVLKQEDTTSQPIAKSIETATAVQAAVADSLVKNTGIEPGTVAKKSIIQPAFSPSTIQK